MVYLYVKYIPLKRKGEVNGFRDMFPSSRTLWLLLFYLIAGLFFLGGLASLFNKEYKRAFYEFFTLLFGLNIILSLRKSPLSLESFLQIWIHNFQINMLLLVAYYYNVNDVMRCSEAIVNGEESPPRTLFKFWDKFVGIK